MLKKLGIGLFFIGIYNLINFIDKKICKNYFYSNFCYSIYNDVVKLIYDEEECHKLDAVENECWIIGEEIYFDKNRYLDDLYLKYNFILPYFVLLVILIFLLKKVRRDV